VGAGFTDSSGPRQITLATRLVDEPVEVADEKVPDETFTNPRLWAAIVARLTFNSRIIEAGMDSYRLAATMAPHAVREAGPARVSKTTGSAPIVTDKAPRLDSNLVSPVGP
jgi:hypothetical protein